MWMILHFLFLDDEQKDAKMCGNVWFYDNSAETFTSDVTGYRSSNTIVLNGDEGYFNHDSKIEISKGSRELFMVMRHQIRIGKEKLLPL